MKRLRHIRKVQVFAFVAFKSDPKSIPLNSLSDNERMRVSGSTDWRIRSGEGKRKKVGRTLPVSPISPRKNGFDAIFLFCAISTCKSSTQNRNMVSLRFFEVPLSVRNSATQIERESAKFTNQRKTNFCGRVVSLSRPRPGGAGFKHRQSPGKFSFLFVGVLYAFFNLMDCLVAVAKDNKERHRHHLN